MKILKNVLHDVVSIISTERDLNTDSSTDIIEAGMYMEYKSIWLQSVSWEAKRAYQ